MTPVERTQGLAMNLILKCFRAGTVSWGLVHLCIGKCMGKILQNKTAYEWRLTPVLSTGGEERGRPSDWILSKPNWWHCPKQLSGDSEPSGPQLHEGWSWEPEHPVGRALRESSQPLHLLALSDTFPV